jgi:hypothetical protein
MRPLLLSDLDLAARVLLALPRPRRVREMDSMIQTARRADRHRRLTGDLLPGQGDGSLLSVALGRRRADPGCAGADYRACLALVLDRLAASDPDLCRH